MKFARKFATPLVARNRERSAVQCRTGGMIDQGDRHIARELGARLPYMSSATMPRPKSEPATMLVGGWTNTSSWAGAAGVTLIALVVTATAGACGQDRVTGGRGVEEARERGHAVRRRGCERSVEHAAARVARQADRDGPLKDVATFP